MISAVDQKKLEDYKKSLPRLTTLSSGFITFNNSLSKWDAEPPSKMISDPVFRGIQAGDSTLEGLLQAIKDEAAAVEYNPADIKLDFYNDDDSVVIEFTCWKQIEDPLYQQKLEIYEQAHRDWLTAVKNFSQKEDTRKVIERLQKRLAELEDK